MRVWNTFGLPARGTSVDLSREGSVTKLRFRSAMSLDGLTAGPEQSKRNPLVIGRGNPIHIASM